MLSPESYDTTWWKYLSHRLHLPPDHNLNTHMASATSCQRKVNQSRRSRLPRSVQGSYTGLVIQYVPFLGGNQEPTTQLCCLRSYMEILPHTAPQPQFINSPVASSKMIPNRNRRRCPCGHIPKTSISTSYHRHPHPRLEQPFHNRFCALLSLGATQMLP